MLHFVPRAMTVHGANPAVKKASVERPALYIALMITNVVMANNVAMASARRGALILVLAPLLELVGNKAKL